MGFISRFAKFTLVSIFLAVGTASAAPGAEKTTAPVIERSRNDISQDLYVTLDASSVEAEEAAERRSKGIEFNDREIQDKSKARFSDLKGRVFPRGALGRMTVVRDHPYVPVVVVRVPDFGSLQQLLALPLVLSVLEEPKLYPNLFQSLPIIGLPVPNSRGESRASRTAAR